jgi:hypothetical protein
MSDKKPVPATLHREIRLCPVCGQVSYSKNGIHPQCAVAQADAPRRKLLVEQKRQLANEKKALTVRKSSLKKCPACGLLLPVHASLCSCGQRFVC